MTSSFGFEVKNDTFKVSVKGNRVKGFDERADVAEKRLVDYLNAWIGKKGDDGRNPMYKLAMSLLQRNEAGDLDYKSISACTSSRTTSTTPNIRKSCSSSVRATWWKAR